MAAAFDAKPAKVITSAPGMKLYKGEVRNADASPTAKSTDAPPKAMLADPSPAVMVEIPVMPVLANTTSCPDPSVTRFLMA